MLLGDVQHADIKTKNNLNKEIKGLTLNFRYDKDNKSDLVDFYEADHRIGFEFHYTESDGKDKSIKSTKNTSKRKSSRSRR